LNDLWPEIQDALKKDLGLSPDNADLFSQMITIKEVIFLSKIDHLISNIDQYTSRVSKETSLINGPAKSYLVPEPLGIVLVMSAWNYPFYTAFPPVATAIAAGNAVVLKPSEL
jgi:aldehyde dehydrogenase (NAD+)